MKSWNTLSPTAVQVKYILINLNVFSRMESTFIMMVQFKLMKNNIITTLLITWLLMQCEASSLVHSDCVYQASLLTPVDSSLPRFCWATAAEKLLTGLLLFSLLRDMLTGASMVLELEPGLSLPGPLGHCPGLLPCSPSFCLSWARRLKRNYIIWQESWAQDSYLFLIHSSWQSWCWGRTSWNETEAGLMFFSQSLSRVCLAVNLLLGSSANIPSRRSRAAGGISAVNSSLTLLLYCFLGFNCWNPGRWITCNKDNNI